MFKYILLAFAVWGLPCAAVHADETSPEAAQFQAPPPASWDEIVKESIDATSVPDSELMPDGTVTSSDLTLDTSFAGGGMYWFWPPIPTGFTGIEDALRVFPYTTCTGPICSLKGYYIVGRQKATDGTWRSWIARIRLDGSQDTTFGTGGWIYPNTNLKEVVDAAMSNGRIYVLSTANTVTPYMYVRCVVLTDGSDCFPGLGGTVTFGAGPAGPVTGAYARRVVYDSRYGLFVAGRVFTTTRGWEIGVARLDAVTGELNTAFHGNGMSSGLPGWAAQTGAYIDVLDMTVTPDGTPGNPLLYVAGTLKRNATDYDGFVLGLHANDGYISSGWGWNAYYHEGDNTGNKKDAITAITVQANGRVAMAGWSETDTANARMMILARALANGEVDESFCHLTYVGDTCRPLRPLIGVADDDLPVAIAERPHNRDLVIALKARSRSGDYHQVQTVLQFGSSGNELHYEQRMDFAAGSGESRWSRPFGMWLGSKEEFGTDEIIAVVGTAKFNATDYDATISQLIPNDSIFAGQFGGEHSD